MKPVMERRRENGRVGRIGGGEKWLFVKLSRASFLMRRRLSTYVPRVPSLVDGRSSA